ncbi:MAG: VOC family protein [Actinomycetota bacterium]|nr:VOC family protein [Actinomycetota bacterium]
MPTITGIDHIALTVTDLTVSLAFYESVMNLRPQGTMTDGPFTRCVLALPGSTHLGLTQHDAGSGRDFDPTTPGLDHLAFACESREQLLGWIGHLDGLGVSHSGVQDADYGSAVSFRDPDGNALELFAPA